MPWDRNQDRRDPALDGYAWKQIKQFWRRQHGPCWRCGLPIRYDLKWPHPMSLVVGHIVSRAEARRAGWPESAINALRNTSPEHVACSNRSGAQLGRQLQDRKPARTTSDRW
jgi:hypothetical protein